MAETYYEQNKKRLDAVLEEIFAANFKEDGE